MAHFVFKIAASKSQIKNVHQSGVVYIRATYNTTLITISANSGRIIAWGSRGACGFRGARKRTPFAAKTVAEIVAKKAIEHGVSDVRVCLCGPGSGREMAIRRLGAREGLNVTLICDVTSTPHNGCRSPKRRRVSLSLFAHSRFEFLQ